METPAPNQKPSSMKLTGRCGHCGEAVDFVVTKADVKAVLKALKQPTVMKAQRYMENYFARRPQTL